MLPPLTDAQTEMAKRYLTVEQYGDMSPDEKESFFRSWLDVFAATIKTEACEKCVPPWLLAGVLLGEVGGMNEYFRIAERTLEEMGFGSSVGLGQITVDTAEKYDLTETAKKFDKICDYIGTRLNDLWSVEAIVVEWMTTPIDDLPTGGASQSFIDNPNYPVKDIARLLIRRELLHPLLGIRASACYLRELIDQAIAKGTIKNYTLEKATPWGEYDFSVIRNPCTDDLVTASSVSDASVVRVWLVAFFAAAHNDDALSGFREGIGLTQGDNALGIAFDLERMDLWGEYDLLDCD